MRRFDSFIPDLITKLWLISAFLIVIGLDVLLAPEIFVVTPAHQIAFDALTREAVGGWMIGTGLFVGYTAKTSKLPVSIWFAAVVGLFWLAVTLLPAFFGGTPIAFLGFTIYGQINTISTLAWGYITYNILALYREVTYGPVVDGSIRNVLGLKR